MAKGSGGTRRRRETRPVSYENASQSYDALVSKTGQTWNSLSEAEKTDIFHYTGSLYTDVNQDLKDGIYSDSYVKSEIDNITSAIEKSSYDKDIVLSRGAKNERSVFGFSIGNATIEQLQSTVGKTYKMNQFGSFSAEANGGFNRPARIILTAPKGTKMMYVEPFSMHGVSTSDKNRGKKWNGQKQKVESHGENEVILQRGTSYKVNRVEQKDGKNYIYATVVKQDKH